MMTHDEPVDVFDHQACKCISNDFFGKNVIEISLTLPLNCCTASSVHMMPAWVAAGRGGRGRCELSHSRY